MQFIARYSTNAGAQIARLKFPIYSRQKIYLYKNGAAEIILNNYLKTNYNITLKAACILITSNAKAYMDENMIIYKVIDKKLNDLAGLITYGNLEINGSDILKAAFKA